MIQRFFTVPEAGALLPRLTSVMEEIRQVRQEIERTADRVQLLEGLWGEKIRAVGNPDREEFLRSRAELERSVHRLERLVETGLLSLGVRLPAGGIEHGLVDFPARYAGRTVYLCWRMGEDQILAWHEVNAGFSGRRPLTEDVALAMGRERDVE